MYLNTLLNCSAEPHTGRAAQHPEVQAGRSHHKSGPSATTEPWPGARGQQGTAVIFPHMQSTNPAACPTQCSTGAAGSTPTGAAFGSWFNVHQ